MKNLNTYIFESDLRLNIDDNSIEKGEKIDDNNFITLNKLKNAKNDSTIIVLNKQNKIVILYLKYNNEWYYRGTKNWFYKSKAEQILNTIKLYYKNNECYSNLK